MSYYRYITGLYKSDLRELNRTLRSSSVPRTVNSSFGIGRRATSVPPSTFYSRAFESHAATPFSDRARSLERELQYCSTYSGTAGAGTYSNLDYKVAHYMSQLDREDALRSCVSQTRNYRSVREQRESMQRERSYSPDSFASRYSFYDGGKHSSDYLYPMTREVLGVWKHTGLSADTLSLRNTRARSPLQTRELDRYYETKKYSNYIGDVSSGGAVDFRHYNYRRVPYFGGSDNYHYMRAKPGRLYTKLL